MKRIELAPLWAFAMGVTCCAVAAVTVADLSSVLGWGVRGDGGTGGTQPPLAADQESTPPAGWLSGTTENRFAQIERHLRGLDVSMAEIGYRYGELLEAARDRNWEYVQYQTEKIDLSLRLAIERRPMRAKSAEPFLEADLPQVLAAIERRDGHQLDRALERLHDSCIECHRAEDVLYFRDSVERIRQRRSAQSDDSADSR